jgi:hypothetical protein
MNSDSGVHGLWHTQYSFKLSSGFMMKMSGHQIDNEVKKKGEPQKALLNIESVISCKFKNPSFNPKTSHRVLSLLVSMETGIMRTLLMHLHLSLLERVQLFPDLHFHLRCEFPERGVFVGFAVVFCFFEGGVDFDGVVEVCGFAFC